MLCETEPEWIRLYTDDKAEIRAAVQRSSHKLAALDLRPKSPAPVFHPAGQKHLARKRRLGVLERMRAAWERRPWAPHRAKESPSPRLTVVQVERAGHER